MRREDPDNWRGEAYGWGLGQIAIVLGIIAVVLIDLYAGFRAEFLITGHDANGTVVAHERVDPRKSDDDDPDAKPKPPKFCAVVDFEVDGTEYQTSTRCEETQPYAIGESVVVRYSPTHEKGGVIYDTHFVVQTILLCAWGLALTALLIVAFIRSLRKKNNQTQPAPGYTPHR